MENKDVNRWDRCDKCGNLFPEDELVRYALMTLCKKCHAETEKK
jgi:formylmethanofuran dehydrogenase subunit E